MKRRSRRNHTNGSGIEEPAADYGQAFRRKDARWVPVLTIAAGQGMELVEIVDIDRPEQRHTKRVARRIDPLLMLLDIYSKEGPGPAQYLAAERFRRDAKSADGLTASILDRLDCRVSESSAGREPTQMMLDAQARVRRAWLAIRGPENDAELADVMRLVVLGWSSLSAVENARRYRHGHARRLFDEGLDRLVAHYEGSRR